MNPPRDQDDSERTQVPAGTVPAARVVSLVDNRIDSRDLFLRTREITIAHGDDIYRLRLTAQNKLILTK